MHLVEDVQGRLIQIAQDDYVDIEGGIMGHVRICPSVNAMRFIARETGGLTDEIDPEPIGAARPDECLRRGSYIAPCPS